LAKKIPQLTNNREFREFKEFSEFKEKLLNFLKFPKFPTNKKNGCPTSASDNHISLEVV
jgi:hypothetical protein